MDLTGRPFTCVCDRHIYGKTFFKILSIAAVVCILLIINQVFLTISENKYYVHSIKNEINSLSSGMCENRQKTEHKLSAIESILMSRSSSNQNEDEHPYSSLAETVDTFSPSKKFYKKCDSNFAVNDFVRNVVTEMLNKYNADKTGRTDFALESAGGCIVAVRKGNPFCPAFSPMKKYMGVKVCPNYKNTPEAIIRPSVMPGECWAFEGSYGSVVIKLVSSVLIDSISLEHIPKALSPTGDISSAPKNFAIYGLNKADDKEGICLGRFIYKENSLPLQTFAVEDVGQPFKYVEFKVLKNHGHPNFTCVYRLRIHGTKAMFEPKTCSGKKSVGN